MLEAFEQFEKETESKAQFESGTLDGLRKNMEDNDGSAVGIFDEFSTFKDNLDKGSSGSAEKGRFLSLFNGSSWKKQPKVLANHR